MSLEAFRAMLSGDWEEEEVILLPDTTLEAFQSFTKYLYSEEVDLTIMDIKQLDSLYYLADKYMADEIKENIIEQAEIWFIGQQDKQSCLAYVSAIDIVKTSPVKEVATKRILEYLEKSSTNGVAAIKCMKDVVDLAGAFCSGRYEKSIMEGMVKAVVISLTDPLLVELDAPDDLIELPQSIVVAQLFENLPKTDDCFKFMFYVMKLYWDFV